MNIFFLLGWFCILTTHQWKVKVNKRKISHRHYKLVQKNYKRFPRFISTQKPRNSFLHKSSHNWTVHERASMALLSWGAFPPCGYTSDSLVMILCIAEIEIWRTFSAWYLLTLRTDTMVLLVVLSSHINILMGDFSRVIFLWLCRYYENRTCD